MSPTDFDPGYGPPQPAAPLPETPWAPVATDPISTPDAWNYVVLGGSISPGQAKVTGCTRKHKWDVPDAKGTAGANPKYNKPELAEPVVELTLWETAQFETLNNFIATAEASLATNPKTALPFEYPEAARNGITDVVVLELGELGGDAKAGWKWTIRLQEYRKPKVVAGSGQGTGGSWTPNVNTPGGTGVAEGAELNAVERMRQLQQQLYDAIHGDHNENVDDSGQSGNDGPEWM